MSGRMTAVEAMARAQQSTLDEHVFKAYCENFIKRWAPQDRDEMADFVSDLMLVARRIYLESDTSDRRTLEMLLRHLGNITPVRPSLKPFENSNAAT